MESKAIITLKEDSDNIFGIRDCSCCDKKDAALNVFTIGNKTDHGSRTSSFRLCGSCLKKLKDVVNK